MTDCFPHPEKFLKSALTLQKVVGVDILDERKCSCLKKHMTILRKEDCSTGCQDELLQGRPQLRCRDRAALDADISLEELIAAVGQMSPGRAPGLDRLPADFYKHFWRCLDL